LKLMAVLSPGPGFAGPGTGSAGGEAAEGLELVDEAFDHVTLVVEMAVVDDDAGAARMRRDHRVGAEGRDRGADAVGVVRRVGDHLLGHLAVEQRQGLRGVVRLAGGEDHANELAERVDEPVEPAAQAAARTANRLITPVFFAPAAC